MKALKLPFFEIAFPHSSDTNKKRFDLISINCG